MAREHTLSLENGRLYYDGLIVENDVLVRDDTIEAIVEDASAYSVDERIDVEGNLVIPGVVDTHTHTREPGYTHKEDFTTSTRAAAAGGVTTIFDMPNVEPATDTVDRFEAVRDLAAEKCVIDWGHWVAGTHPEEVPKLADAGATGFKIFQVKGEYPHLPELSINDDAEMLASFEAISETGLPILIHPFNQAIFDYLSEQAWESGKPKNHETFSEIYTEEINWKSAVSTLLHLQEETGVRLHLLHTHAAESLRLIERAQERGQDVTAECDPKYFQLTREDLDEKGPKCTPGGFITHQPERMETIWESIRDGPMDIIGTDHAPHLIEEIEEQRENAWVSAMGSPQHEDYVSLLFTDANDGKVSYERLVEILSVNPAKRVGAYPKKGSTRVGTDADFAVIDTDYEWTRSVDDELYTKCGWSPYEGWTFTAKPVLTVLRGDVVMESGNVVAEPGDGEYVRGTVNPETDDVAATS